ncbi:hypothetical protein [Paenibacillus sp. FSL R10-2734]|uniref:hypothetical protein n=1 Tax=Paenibacillus sp. FSL R10-2734 TaxID=2954691 RepID=UPI0030D8D910
MKIANQLFPAKLQLFLHQKESSSHKWGYTCTFAVFGLVEEDIRSKGCTSAGISTPATGMVDLVMKLDT